MKYKTVISVIIILLISFSYYPLFEGDANHIEYDETIITKLSEPSNIDIPKLNNGHFTENKGQWDSRLLFVANTNFGQIGLGKGCVYFNLREIIKSEEICDDILLSETSKYDEPRNLKVKDP